ncbi:SAM-dependent methyltransferase [Frankia sp. KB5]|uniref:SAM-dependent methyltransferase n=1 Tax=Frankia sp. KB5 TaxID=683318 RepID=UPI0024110FE8|nr:SAM-dependent methyltransferase [Frankia sp. KB5]
MGSDAGEPIGAEEPNVARVYDALLGGAHNFPADREAAARIERTWPGSREGARVNRLFLGEAVRFLAGQAGTRQFLDIGSGMPIMGNVHEVASELATNTRVVYVDHDPVVVAHSQVLLTSTPGAAAVEADLADPPDDSGRSAGRRDAGPGTAGSVTARRDPAFLPRRHRSAAARRAAAGRAARR